MFLVGNVAKWYEAKEREIDEAFNKHEDAKGFGKSIILGLEQGAIDAAFISGCISIGIGIINTINRK